MFQNMLFHPRLDSVSSISRHLYQLLLSMVRLLNITEYVLENVGEERSSMILRYAFASLLILIDIECRCP